MSQTTPSSPPPLPPPPSFNDFSFMSIGPRRSLLDRLNMVPQPGSAAGESTDLPATTFPPAPIDTSTISLVSEGSIPGLATSDTVNSSLLGPATPPLIPGDAPTLGSSNMSPAKAINQTAPLHPVSASDMEIDEPANPDIVELPRPSPPRIPESYRSLPADHYLVAPPTVLPYPRSPPIRIDENHPLYTPASLFAHLPRAPPLSPRLDPLAILELETTRERSEWEQVCQGLGRPSLSASVVANSFSAHLERTQPVPQSPPVAQTNVERSPSGPASAPTSPLDPDSDVDSSDVELRVYDHVSPAISTLPTLGQDADNSQTRPARSVSQSGSTSALISGPSPSSTARVQPLQPKGLFGLVPHRTESAFGKGGVGPASSSVANGETTDSPESSNATPVKRKHRAIDDSAQPSAPEPTRVGVPPPLRASVDRTHVPTPTPVPEGASTPTVAAAPPANTVPTLAPVQAATPQPPLSSAPTPAPDAVPQPARKPCRFYNRPPGRVCVRKEQCPDLHEGPLQKPLSPVVLAASTIPAFPSPFGTGGSPGIPPASGTATPSTTAHEATAVSRPQLTASPRPLTPVNATPESSAAPTASRPTAPPAASALSKRIASAGLPPRPLSSVDRPATPACRFFNTPKGCSRGGECPFRHEPKSSSRPSRTQSGDSGASASGPPVASVPQPAAIASQSGRTRLPAAGSLRVSPEAGDSAEGTSTAPRNTNVPVAQVDAVVVKIERESPAPKSFGNVKVSQPKSRAEPPPMSREVKEEEVSLRNLGDGLDQEMVDGTAKDTGGPTLNNGSILPAFLSSVPIPERPSVPDRIPSQTAPQAVSIRVPATVSEQPSTNAEVGLVLSAPASAPPPPVLATVVIPPTPDHPPATGKGAARPSVAPARPPSRDSRRLDPHDRREPTTQRQDAPRRAGRPTRSGSDTYRPSYNPRRSPSRSPSPPRSRGRSPIGSRDIRHFAPAHGLGRFHPRVGEMLLRLSLPGLEDTPPGDPSRRVWIPAMPDLPGTVARPVALGAQKDIIGDGVRRRHPETDVCPYEELIRRVAEFVGRLVPLLAEYRPMDSRVAPPNRSPLVEDRGYDNGAVHYPPGVNTPRTWEANDRRSPTPLEATSYGHNIQTDRDTEDTRLADPTYPSHPSGHPQDSSYYSGLRPGFSVEMPQASSTPSRPPASVESNANLGIPKKPIVMPANYDNFEQSAVMEASSPEVRNPPQARLQDRVVQYPGFVPAAFVPVETTGPSLYARLTQDREQLPLAERLASSESHQPSRGTYGKGSKSTPPSNNVQLAARLGVNAGEKSQSLANRFVDEPRHRPSYQNRDREPPARPGGGLMARMVGEKKPA